jgi:gluconokinase
VIVVLMGVSGSGKTIVGRALAEAMRWPFFDADDFHPAANVAKMAAGESLDDHDRAPWLDAMSQRMSAINAQGANAVLACSALKAAYRNVLLRAGDVRFIFLCGDEATIAPRLSARSHAFMPASLLHSQFAALEEPRDAYVVDIRLSVAEQVALIRHALSS